MVLVTFSTRFGSFRRPSHPPQIFQRQVYILTPNHPTIYPKCPGPALPQRARKKMYRNVRFPRKPGNPLFSDRYWSFLIDTDPLRNNYHYIGGCRVQISEKIQKSAGNLALFTVFRVLAILYFLSEADFSFDVTW